MLTLTDLLRIGAGQGMLENKDPITTSIQDSLIGGLSGCALGAGGAYLQKGIPTNRELEQKRNQTKSSTAKSTGKGRWVTINGNHVFIED